ncbi:uncharacterized protein LOC110989150 isoform X2 [Acanthaster planci]|uniref:Uncharacterized protein LOC110989150 isoform X2 n=1 Tax=Acanthaster planci TaxID=133434 RepID=A0A8B7ZV86_ACAPL|nr:uncharacterized protein LOC110989150 isoform X2 [Acanthaster planci]
MFQNNVATVSSFNRFVLVFPFQSFTGYKPTAELYRTVVGVIEITFGALLAFGNYHWHRSSSLVLLCLMIGALYTILALGDPVQNIVPSVVVGALLILLINREGHYRL